MNSDFTSQLLEQTPDAVIAISPENKVLYWNHAAETVFGYAQAEAMGHSLRELIVPADREETEREILKEALKKGLVVCESLGRHKDGSLVHVSVSTKAVSDDAGKLRYFLSTHKDVTHLKV